MTLDQIAQNGIVFCNNVYVPQIVPADYGGSVFYQATMHLCDGTVLTHSSCELENRDENTLYDQVLALMRKDVLSRGIRPRCDCLDIEKTLNYWKLIGKKNTVNYAVSACLAGEYCRYDGGNNLVPCIAKLVESGIALPICPEASGGLETPRTPCEIVKSRVISKDGLDRTDEFQAGAQHAFELIKRFDIEKAVLKQRSPSCGFGKVYDGSFSGRLLKGNGIAAQLLKENGIEITTEEDWQ